jgi:cytoskeleton protein RodZ
MGTFGERLRRERETRGITLEQVSESTKISSRSLQALEQEEFDKLPGGIFNKGFVRAYAHHLGLDEEQAVADFVAASGGEKEQPLPDPPIPRAVALGQRTEAQANWRAFALLVLLLAILVATAWKLGPLALHEISGIISARAKAQPEQPRPAPNDVAQAAPDVQVAAPLPHAQRKPTVKAQPVTVAAGTPVTSPGAALPETIAPAEKLSSSFVVQVVAKQDTWVQIVADGKLLTEGVLIPPAEKQVHAAKEVVIKTRNAAGVEVSLNGRLLPPLGGENEAATVTLNAGGVQR